MTEVNLTCPLGKECEEIRDNTIYRCRWYQKVEGKHPQTDKYVDGMDCAVAWVPVLLVQVSNMSRWQKKATEALRDSVDDGNKVMLAAAQMAMEEENARLPSQ